MGLSIIPGSGGGGGGNTPHGVRQEMFFYSGNQANDTWGAAKYYYGDIVCICPMAGSLIRLMVTLDALVLDGTLTCRFYKNNVYQPGAYAQIVPVNARAMADFASGTFTVAEGDTLQIFVQPVNLMWNTSPLHYRVTTAAIFY